MHLVFLNQYYPPDAAPTGVMLAAVVEELAAQGHAVTVICAEGGYAGGERRTSNDEHRTSNVENVAAVCDRRTYSSPRHAPSREERSSDGHRPPLHTTIRVLRIRATRFGRGTFVGKVMDYLSYYVGVAWKLLWLRPRPGRIVALTTPPYLSVLARVCSKIRGGDHAHWVMDLYPDVMVAHGMLREGSLPHRLLAGLARWGFGGRRCAALLTLGPDMAERVGEVLAVGGWRLAEDHEKSDPAAAGPASRDQVGRPGPSNPTWIPLWGGEHRTLNIEHRTSKDESKDHLPSTIHDPRSLRHGRGWGDDELVVMYSGNMGLGHRFGEILEVMGRVNIERRTPNIERRSEVAEHLPSPIPDLQSPLTDHSPPSSTAHCSPLTDHSPRFVFFGGGKRRGEIERFVAAHPEAAVELHDYAPAADLGIHLRSADVHLVSLAAEWTGTMVPSKLQGIFHAARPVIFIGEATSSIGGWVVGSGGGWVVAPGDVAGLERALDEARDPLVRESRGRAAKAFAKLNFDKQVNVRKVAEVLAG